MKSAVVHTPVSQKERAALGLRAGDTVRVWQKIEELKKVKGANKKETTSKNIRKQAFEGLVLAVKHGTEPGAMFTVRKVSLGVGVEKIFPLYSPMIDSIEIIRRARTRRAKLYFIREKAARDVKRQIRKSSNYVAPEMEADEVVEPVLETAEEVVESTDVEATPQEEVTS